MTCRAGPYTDAGAQHTSSAFTGRLAAAGISGSAGTAGDACGNARAQSVTGSFKTEPVKPPGPWRTAEQADLATMEYVDWLSRQRLCEACRDISPAELEAAYHRQIAVLAQVSHSTN